MIYTPHMDTTEAPGFAKKIHAHTSKSYLTMKIDAPWSKVSENHTQVAKKLSILAFFGLFRNVHTTESYLTMKIDSHHK
jgi:hypothetical protein